VNKSEALRTLLLTLKELEEKHNGENMTIIILNVLSIYAIRNRLDYFVMNNATNNDTMVKTIARNFQEIDDVRYDSIEHRFRCIDHIINSFVQTFLLASILMSKTIIMKTKAKTKILLIKSFKTIES